MNNPNVFFSHRQTCRFLILAGIAVFRLTIGPVHAQSPFATQDPLAQALTKSDVYVGKTLRAQVSQDALLKLTSSAKPERPLKLAVLNTLPGSGKVYGTRGAYAKALHDYLGLKQGTLILVTKNGASVATDSLPVQKSDEILKNHIGEIQRDPVAGILHTVEDLEQAAQNGNVASAPNGAPNASPNQVSKQDDAGLIALGLAVMAVPVIAIGGGLVWLFKSLGAKRKRMQVAYERVKVRRGEVLEGIVYSDAYLDLLPDSQSALDAKRARKEAAELLDQAAAMAKTSRTPEEMERVEAILDLSKTQTDLCRRQIDIATGGTGLAMALENGDFRATPLTPDGATAFQPAPQRVERMEDIPVNERGACFFCSCPSRIDELTPITITENGKRRKVLACVDDVRSIQGGAAPAVRSVSYGGRSIPWYQAPGYDPYRDYSRNVSYCSSYDSGFWDALFISSMLSQPVYYPIFVGSDGGYSNSMDDSAMQPNYDSGMSNSPEYVSGNDSSNFDGAASEDFFGNGGSDFGGDSGGGWSSDSSSDSGGFDFGGFDSGGSDFGGGDSGGGGGD